MTTPIPAPTQVAARLAPYGSTIFTEISRLAVQYNAINLGQGFPNFDGPEFVKRAAVDAMTMGHNQYARSFGVPHLNKAIARRFEHDSGLSFDPDTQITVTNGCTEAIAATFLGLINPGDEVIMFEPFYDSYRACASMAGAEVKVITLAAPDFALDEQALRAAFSDRTRAILLNTPHNPTGKVFTRAELQMIADLCKQHDVIVISDEVYEKLVFEGEHISIATLEGMYERTLTLSSLGKTFSFTGWKIGWAIGPAELNAGVRAAHQFLTFCSATPFQHAAAAALDAPQSYYTEFLAAYRKRRDLLVDGLRGIGFNVYQPAGTYFVLADHTPFGFEDDMAFCRHLVEHCGVAAIPPSSFYHHREYGRSLVRFAFCKTEDELREAIRRMIALA